MPYKQEQNFHDVSAIITAMTDGEQFFLYDTVKTVLSDTCIVQVVLCIESKNNWVNNVLGKLTEDKKLEIIRLPLKPPGAIRNNAINYVRMPWVAFCDGDDIWCKGKIKLQRSCANKTGCDFVGADHYLTDEAGKIRAFALARYMPMLSSWMVRTEVMKQFPFNETLYIAEDGNWWSRTAGKIVKARIPKMLLKYRVRSVSLSTTDASKKRKAKIVSMGSIPVIGSGILLLTRILWLFTRKKQYIWHKSWGKQPG